MVHVVVTFAIITVLGFTEEWFMLLLLFCYHYCLRFDRGVVHVVVVAYSINHYCLMFHRRVVHVVVVILSNITV